MKVTKLSLNDYRNIEKTRISPNENINVILGDNAQGKTNLLESIWLFTGNKSFRSTRENDLINFDKTQTTISIEYTLSEKEKHTSEIKFSKTEEKKVYIDKVKKSSSATLLRKFNAVVFSPIHLSLVKGGPLERRKFLDTTLCQTVPGYAVQLVNYKKILLQRNALLKDCLFHSELFDTLPIWDEKLTESACQIILTRAKYLKALSKEAVSIYAGISQHNETLKIKYLTCLDSNFIADSKVSLDNIKKLFLEKLKISRQIDLKYKFTTVGPHRDDINFFINEHNAQKFASQGQQRSIVLALKLGESAVLKKWTGHTPVVLLDDVMSELDTRRQNYILNSIKNWQVFITCCDASSITRLVDGDVFHIKKGEINF